MIWLVEVDNNKSTLPVVFSGRSASSFPQKNLEIGVILTRGILVKNANNNRQRLSIPFLDDVEDSRIVLAFSSRFYYWKYFV